MSKSMIYTRTGDKGTTSLVGENVYPNTTKDLSATVR